MPELITRSTPRISLSKLGEYTTANALRRRAIVKDQKKPRTIYVARYAKAEEAVREFLAGGGDDFERLIGCAKELATQSYDSDWKTENAQLSAKAIHSFVSMAEDVSFGGCTPIANIGSSPKLRLAGVEISVRPEVLLVNAEDSTAIVGALKLYFSKTHPLGKGAGEFAASVLYRHVAEQLSNEAAAKPRSCHVLDVFAGQVFTASNAYKSHIRHAEALCFEIAALWPLV